MHKCMHASTDNLEATSSMTGTLSAAILLQGELRVTLWVQYASKSERTVVFLISHGILNRRKKEKYNWSFTMISSDYNAS